MAVNYFVGWAGVGNSIELEEIKETEKAYYVQIVDEESCKFWIPKSAFDDNGSLTEYGLSIYHREYKNYINRCTNGKKNEYGKILHYK